jgi:hypothetical protein
MMALPLRFPRVEDVLGSRIDQLSEETLRAIVARKDQDPVREAADLDFKSVLYDRGDAGKNDLAADIAAMANSQGGIILLGIGEENGVAASLKPVSISDEEERRMHSIVSDSVFPRVEFEVRPIRSAASVDQGFYAIVVPRSSLAPHGQRMKGSWRYYVRNGAANRLLSESEIADAYRRRFAAHESRAQRLEEVHGGVRGVPTDSPFLWLALSLVPMTPGAMMLDRRTLGALREWATTYARGSAGDSPFGRHYQSIQATTGVGRAILIENLDCSLTTDESYVELHSDGSAFTARALRFGPQPEQLVDEEIVLSVAGMLRFATDHATRNAAARGDALVQLGWPTAAFQKHAAGYALGHGRSGGSRWNPLNRDQTVPLLPETPVRSVHLDSIASDATDWILATRMLVTDIFQAFGVPEVPQISSNGEIRSRYFSGTTVSSWRAASRLPKVETIAE